MDDNLTHGERVKASIIDTGLALWRDDPSHVTARRIGRQLGLTHAACLYHFGNVDKLKAAIAAAAVSAGDVVIVPQLIALRHPAADALSAADRRRYLDGC